MCNECEQYMLIMFNFEIKKMFIYSKANCKYNNYKPKRSLTKARYLIWLK